MPSAKVLEQKKQSVVQLTEKLKNAAAGVVVDYKGITVADDTKLRKELREAGIEYTVVKNTLLRFVDGGVIDAAKVNELGKLPGREELLSMLCSALQGNIRGLAVALNAIAEKQGEPAGDAAPAEEAPAAE